MPFDPDPVSVRIVHPYDDWLVSGGVLEAEGYCFPDNARDHRAEVRYWDPGLGDLNVLHGTWVPPIPPFHWKFHFPPTLPGGIWVSLVVYCRHPLTDDIGECSCTVYCPGHIATLRTAKKVVKMKTIKSANKGKRKKARR